MSRRKKKKGRAGRILNAAGTTMIVIVVLLCSLLVLPKLFGYQMYHVLSGSMEPELPVGSLIYVRSGEPKEVQEGDIIAFYGAEEETGIITHRVVGNNEVSGTFQTKGDANEREDPQPVPYGNYIGQVEFSLPCLGKAITCLATLHGRIAAVSVVFLGVVLSLGSSLLEKKEAGEEEAVRMAEKREKE